MGYAPEHGSMALAFRGEHGPLRMLPDDTQPPGSMGAYLGGGVHVSMVAEDWLCLVTTDWVDDGHLPARCIYVTLWSGRVKLMRVAEHWADLGTWGSGRQLFGGSNERRAHAMFQEQGMLCKATSIGFSLELTYEALVPIEIVLPG